MIIMNKLNILVLVPSFAEKGPIIVAKNIAKYSKNNSIKYTFISLRTNSNSIIKENEFNFYEIGMKKIPFKKDINKIIDILDKLNPDIVHAHGFWPTFITSKYLSNYITVTTLHNNPKEDYIYNYGVLLGNLMVYFLKKHLKNFNSVIAISDYVKSILKKMCLDNINVIYNGVEDKLSEVDTSKVYSKNKEINLITVAALNKIKNISYALEIIKELKNNDFNIKYIIIGNGPQKKEIKRLINKKDLNDVVRLLGELPREEVFEYLFKSDIFIFTSKSEGFGLAVAESMMMKTPAIVNDIPVMHELIDNYRNGIIAQNTEDFIEGIDYVTKNLSDLSVNARKQYEDNFSVEKMAKKYEIKYIELLGE